MLENDGWVCLEIRKRMYGLLQTENLGGKLAKHLATYGYVPTRNTARLWTHATKYLTFTLCVGNFLIKYANKEDEKHLL